LPGDSGAFGGLLVPRLSSTAFPGGFNLQKSAKIAK